MRKVDFTTKVVWVDVQRFQFIKKYVSPNMVKVYVGMLSGQKSPKLANDQLNGTKNCTPFANFV